MDAKIKSTTEVVDLVDIKGNPCVARVWEGVSEVGVPFTAYITNIQVARHADNSQFEAELREHVQPSADTRRAIDLRFIL